MTTNQANPPSNNEGEMKFEGLASILAESLGNVYLHRLRVLIATVVMGAIGLAVAFLLPKIYSSSTTFLIASSQKGGDIASLAGSIEGTGLSSLLGGGIGNRTTARELLSILSTRDFALAAIDTFRLDTVWDLKRSRWENLQKKWAKDFKFEEDDNEALIISFQCEDSLLSRKVVAWSANHLERKYQDLKKGQIELELEYLNERVKERKQLVEMAEDSLSEYQRKFKIFSPEDQIKFLSSTLMESEREIAELDQKIEIASLESGANSQPVKYLSTLRKHLDKNVEGMLESSKPGQNLSKSIPINIQKALGYARRHREIVLHGKVYAYLLQQQEQTALEKLKNIPLLRNIDAPRTPSLKIAPPRMAILAISLFLGFTGSVLSVLFQADFKTALDVFKKRTRLPD